MKTRMGFVSNSSSCSFCILGYPAGMEKVAKALNVSLGDNNDYYIDMDKIHQKAQELGYDTIFSGEDPDHGYIGFSIDGFSIEQILELGCQPNDEDTSIAGLRRIMGEHKDPIVHSGEIET